MDREKVESSNGPLLVRRGGCAIKKCSRSHRIGADGVVVPATILLYGRMSPPRRGIYNARSIEKFRRGLRKSLTAAEAVLWKNLKGRQLLGKKFRRQASIGRYIVDFYCQESRLVIELDGARHFSITIDDYETVRTQYLEAQGLKVIRFENKELYENFEAVLERIREAVQS